MKNKYQKIIVVIGLIVVVILLSVVVWSKIKNQQLLTKEVTHFKYADTTMVGSWVFEIQVKDGIITAVCIDDDWMNNKLNIIENEWSDEKFTSYLTELSRIGVLSWRKEYGKRYVDRITDQLSWYLDIEFSDGMEFYSHGYYVTPNKYDEFIDISMKYFSEEN